MLPISHQSAAAGSVRDPLPPVLAVGLLSAASLGFELLLLRWFAILYWHHFAHMIISVALLGLGVAGSVLTVTQNFLLQRFNHAFRIAACGFALSLPVVMVLVGRIGFNPLEVVWDHGQLWRLTLVFLVSATPFVFSGFGIGLALRRFPDRVSVLYRADLAGAAAGAVGVPVLLAFVMPQTVLRWLAVPALIAALAVRQVGTGLTVRRFVMPLAVAVILAAWPAAMLIPPMSSYKALSQTLQVPGTRVAGEQTSPAGIAAAVESEIIPFRYAPGLSMLAAAEPPSQTALFLDGHAAGTVDHGALDKAAYLDWVTAALPYVMAPPRPRVLVLGAGGGTDVRQARRADAVAVDAVEASGALLRLVRRLPAPGRGAETETCGAVAGRAAVRWTAMEPRSFLAATGATYDIIQISTFGTAAPYADAAQAMREHYLYTVEGISLMLRRLSDDGVLAVTLPLDIPPRAPIKLLATLVAAAQAEGLADPALRTAAVRSWNTVTLLTARRPLQRDALDALRDFCRQRAFDTVWYPGMDAAAANRFNVLDRPYFYEAASVLLQGDGADYLRRYPFHVRPATDDRPYFGRFFRWSTFPEWWRNRAAGTAPFLEWSYLLAWMFVAAALLLAVPLVGLPLRPLIRSAAAGPGGRFRNLSRGLYFTALGLAFLSLEIVFIQKFILFLGHPVASMAVVVPSFLAFAGCGSGWSERFAGRIRKTGDRRFHRPVMAAVLIMIFIAAVYAVVLPVLFRVAAGWPMFARIAVSTGLIGLLAVWMGMPFPLGLKRLGASRPEWIPLAWGINGIASVISAVGAGLMAMHAGFRMVTLAALLLYLAAAALEKRL